MIDGFGAHAFHKAEFIRNRRSVREEVAHPRAALAALLEGFDRSEDQFAFGIAGHGAEAFASQVFVRDWLAVHLLQLGFVIEQIDVSRGAVRKQVDHPPGFRREMREPPGARQSALRLRRGQPFPPEQGSECRAANAARGPPKEFTAGDMAAVFSKGIHGDYSLVKASSRFKIARHNPA